MGVMRRPEKRLEETFVKADGSTVTTTSRWQHCNNSRRETDWHSLKVVRVKKVVAVMKWPMRNMKLLCQVMHSRL
jgi:hypothetical protein